MEKKDLIVLGSGPGGYVSAIRASQLGRKVTLVEKSELGGVCLNWGCIPSKALLRSAQLYRDISRSEEFGFETDGIKVDFPKVIQRSRNIASKMEGGVKYLMKKNKVEVIKGTGKIAGAGVLSVTTDDGSVLDLHYKDIIIAVGAKPKEIPGFKVDGKVVHTYRTILDYRILPQKLLVVGAGAIGIEMAYFFNALGTKVTVVEMLPNILPNEDHEISQALQKELSKQGIKFFTNSKIRDIKQTAKTISCVIETSDSDEKYTSDCCLLAVGVTPNTDGLGLDKAGVEVDERGFIVVDEYMRTTADHHFAIGDVVGAPMLAHKASHEGLVAAESAEGIMEHPMRYDNIPACTYCQPQVASIGLTEQACKERGIKYRVGKMPFSAIGKAVAIGESEGMCKIILDSDLGEVLGVHIMHSEATELIGEAAIIRTHEAIGTSILDTIHPHPTLSESIPEAVAIALGRPINF